MPLVKLTNGGITIEVNPIDIRRYIAAGYVRAIEQPAVRKQAEVAPSEAEKPKRQKAGKKED